MDPDFGIYHHSNREESEKLRKNAELLFNESFKKTGMDRESEINILDAGCGLGFLTYIASSYFINARIYALDKFSGNELQGISVEKLKINLETLKISDRVDVIEGDLAEKLNLDESFDLVVSNLVLHNLGRSRFRAYENIKSAMKEGSYFINADGFIRRNIFMNPLKNDMNKLNGIFEPAFAMSLKGDENFFFKYILVGLKPVFNQP